MLSLAVPLDGGRLLLAILPPIIRMARAPLLRTVAAYLAIFRICRDFLAVIVCATAALAVGAAAHQLPRLILRRQEGVLAEAASPFDHTAVVASCGLRLSGRDLETAVECLLHPGRWLLSLTSTPPEMLPFYSAINNDA